MIKLSLLFITTFLMSQSDFDTSFITQYEYGKMLYNNPRGISCTTCHADDAKGKIISTFTHRQNKKKYICSIETEDITNISYEKFLTVLDPNMKKNKKIFDKTEVCEKLTYRNSMPTYFLTQDELKSIYFYISNREKYDE
ncbi:MAG: c-type cytochrome [Campylobacterota bacterium]|nr:c-type cytochrome [Campylobacterota bacterium]